MSDEEKAAQVGVAVQEYQNAKVGLAQIDKKVSTIADAYSECSAALKHDLPFDVYAIGSPKLRLSQGKNPSAPSLLLDETGLHNLLKEREEARARVKDALKEMRKLGITNLE